MEKAQHSSLLLEVLQNADDKFLTLLDSTVADFCEFFAEIGSVKGIRWDDVVVKFEWS